MRARALPFVTLILAAGCTTWAPAAAPAPDSGVRTATGPVRIVTIDSVVHVGRDLGIDSQVVRYTTKDGIRDSLPRRTVARIEERKFSPARTVLLLGVTVAFGLALQASTEGMMDGMSYGF